MTELTSLTQHNAKALERVFGNRPHFDIPNGIACPSCGKELVDDTHTIQIQTNPPQYKCHCPACGWMGARFI